MYTRSEQKHKISADSAVISSMMRLRGYFTLARYSFRPLYQPPMEDFEALLETIECSEPQVRAVLGDVVKMCKEKIADVRRHNRLALKLCEKCAPLMAKIRKSKKNRFLKKAYDKDLRRWRKIGTELDRAQSWFALQHILTYKSKCEAARLKLLKMVN